jgi:DNA repair protein RadC
MASPKVRDVSMQPRERLLDFGVNSLDTVELLSILGLPKEQAIEFMSGLGDLNADPYTQLRQTNLEELKYWFKFSDAKVAILLAALELGRRVFLPTAQNRSILDRPESVAAAFPDLQCATVEKFGVALVDVKNRMIAKRITSVGTIDETIAHPREVFRDAVRLGAAGIILVHNHPTGQTSPSSEDLRLTEQLIACGRTLQISVLDHVILGHGEFTSLRRTTSLWSTYSKEAEQ